MIHRYPDHVWVFLHEFPALTGERSEQFHERRREYERRVEAVLRAGIDSGEFRDVDPRLTALAWLGMHNYTYLWLKAGGRLTAHDVAQPFAEIFIRGISKGPVLGRPSSPPSTTSAEPVVHRGRVARQVRVRARPGRRRRRDRADDGRRWRRSPQREAPRGSPRGRSLGTRS